MNADHVELLRKLGACSEGLKFAAGFRSFKAAWEACENPEWMVWWLRYGEKTPKEVFVRIAVFAAELVLPLFEQERLGDERPRKAIDAAKRWLAEPTEKSRRAAAAAHLPSAAAARLPSAAACASASAAACACGAYAASYAASYAAAAASYAAASYAATSNASKTIRAKICAFIRKETK